MPHVHQSAESELDGLRSLAQHLDSHS